MKRKLLLVAASLCLAVGMNAQTNTFPASGNVGIGTTSPSNKLEVIGGNSYFDPNYSLYVPSIGSSYFWKGATDGIDNVRFSLWSKLTFYNPTTAGLNTNNADWNIQLGARDGSIYTRGGAYFAINTGNVGIGTTDPSSKLAIQNTNEGSSFSVQSTYTGNNKIFEITQESSDGFLYLRSAAGTINTKLSGYWNTPSYFMTNVLIGKTTQTNTAYKLDVAGKIRADEITVNTTGADFVFENNYKLRPLSEVETFIKANKHLPDLAPAAEMQTNGLSMGNMQAKLLQKVEELTLYSIEQDKKLAEQAKAKVEQDKKNAELQKQIDELKTLIIQKLK